jgi:hypothetical protein
MTIYLYVKTHNITGLKYLGKTSSKDPINYKGSGTVWMRHIKKHGYDVTTEILKECNTNDEIRAWGKHYSELWNIVDDNAWANLKPEEGDGGARKGQTAWNKGLKGVYKHSIETNARQSARQLGSTRKPLTEETKLKIRQKLLGRKKGPTSVETKLKISQSKRLKNP